MSAFRGRESVYRGHESVFRGRESAFTLDALRVLVKFRGGLVQAVRELQEAIKVLIL